jgi:hypothetical protein
MIVQRRFLVYFSGAQEKILAGQEKILAGRNSKWKIREWKIHD